MHKLTALPVVAVMAVATLATGTTSPAYAAGCYYKVFNTEGRYLNIRGVGHAAKKKWACNRARRKCNRRLDRAKRNRTLPGRYSTYRGILCKRVG